MAKLHYGWVVAGIVFLTVMLPAAVRGLLSVLAVPLEGEYGWPRSVVSSAAAISMLLFGFLAPFAATFVVRFGARTVLMGGLALLTACLAAAPFLSAPWAFVLVWGVLAGFAGGVLGIVTGTAVIRRWFDQGQGLATGILSAGIATAQLVILPPAAVVVSAYGWRAGTIGLAVVCAVVGVAAWRWLREGPIAAPTPADPSGKRAGAFSTLRDTWRRPAFWALAGPFFVCGFGTGGLIAVHLVPASIEHGVPEVQSALLLSAIGVFDLVGTVASGWLTDRYNNAWLLGGYYGIRGLSLLALPMLLPLGGGPLLAFALVYGLGWVATVPPTSRLCTRLFGPERGSIVFGWVFTTHQLGAATAAVGAGLVHDAAGSYTWAFLAAAVLTLLAAAASLTLVGLGRPPRPTRASPDAAPAPPAQA